MTDEERLAELRERRRVVDREIERLCLLQYLVIPTIIGPFLVGRRISELYRETNSLGTDIHRLSMAIGKAKHEQRMAEAQAKHERVMAYIHRPLDCYVPFGAPCPRRACRYCKEM